MSKEMQAHKEAKKKNLVLSYLIFINRIITTKETHPSQKRAKMYSL